MSNPEKVFFVNNIPIVVRTHTLTVREILDDAGLLPTEHKLFEERNGNEVACGELDAPVTLRHDAHFKAHRTAWHIWVNGTESIVHNDKLTFNEVVAHAKDLPPPAPGVEYTVAFEKARHPHEGTMISGECVHIKDGTEFEVTATNRS